MSCPESSRAGEVPQGKRWRLDDRRNAGRIVRALYVLCALLLAADLLVGKHGPFAIEHWFGFYGIYGFAACVIMVLAARLMRRFLIRPEDYYDR